MSILRSSQFVRTILSDLRFGGGHPRTGLDTSVGLHSKLLSVCCSRYSSQSTKADYGNIDKAIQKLDREARRFGRISRRELVSVVKDMRNTGRATSTQSLFMIRCCGNLVPEVTPESRSKLVGEVWETFEKLGVPLDISHYNALLSVYLENEFVFSTKDFLSKLEAKGIEPNRVTYQRLVASCCSRGDIEEATDILQIMKDKQIPINESIFNSLITGHSFANDMESAVGILSTMAGAGLEASTETYSALISGYARNGDIEGIIRTLDECKAKEIVISDRDILEAAFVLATNDHLAHLDKLLGLVSRSSDSIEDAKNVALRLTSRGCASAAIAILKIITPSNSAENESLQKGNYLIRHAIKANWPEDKIVSFCDEMKNLKYNEFGLHVAVESCIINKKLDLAIKLLSALAEREPLAQHYFWPILVQHGKANNFQGVVTTLRTMLQLMNQSISGETLKDYVMPHLKQDNGVEQLRQAGIPLATSASAMVGHLLCNSQIEEAAKWSLQYRARYNNVTNRRALINAYKETRNVNALLTLIQVLAETDEDESDVPGQILMSIFRWDKSQAEVILPKFLEVGIGLTKEHAEAIKERLGEAITPEIEDILTELTSSKLVQAPLARQRQAPLKRVSVEKDETTILNAIRAVERRGDSAAGLKRQLLLYYCHNKELEKALALKAELEKEGLDMQPGLLVLFMDLFCHHEKLDEALEYYNKAKQVEGSKLDGSKAIRLAMLLTKQGRYKDAVDILRENPQTREETSDSNLGNLTASWRLLNTCAEKGEVDAIKQLFDALINQNYVEPSNIVLGPLVKVHILQNDVEGALQQFEEFCIKYRATPWKNELTCKLIEREDAASLQKIADLSTQIHGEVNSLYDLVLSFVECKKVKQARKILETPGLRTRTQRISAACNRYYLADQVHHLITLLAVTKGFNHIDRSEIFSFLLMCYKKTDNVDQAAALWTQMQEEDVKPSEKFLVELGGLLEKHGRAVPFEFTKPDAIPPLTPVRPVASPKIKLFRKALNGKNLDEALALKNDIKDENMTKGDISRLLNLLVNNGRIGEASKMLVSWLEKGMRPDVSALSYAVNGIAKIGDVDAMNLIGSHLSDEWKKMVSFVNRYTHCMVEAGRAADAVEELKRIAENAKTPEEIKEAGSLFPRGGIFSVFETAPELLPQVEEMVEVYRQKGMIEPTNMLWAYYYLKGYTEKADETWKLLAPHDRIMFMPIIKQARSTFDINLVETLLAQCKSVNLAPQAIGILYTSIMDILLSQDKLTETENKLEEALKFCALDDLGRSILIKIKKNVELSGKEFKYRIPDKKTRASRTQRDSSSESSSDSDNEETKKQSQRA